MTPIIAADLRLNSALIKRRPPEMAMIGRLRKPDPRAAADGVRCFYAAEDRKLLPACLALYMAASAALTIASASRASGG